MNEIKTIECKSVCGVNEDNLPFDNTNTNLSVTNTLLTNITKQLIKLININIDIKEQMSKSLQNETVWYDNSTTIATAVTTAPTDPDSSSYTSVKISDLLGRNSPNLTIYNDGPGALYIIISHKPNQFTNEFPLYEGEAKTYKNIRELRLRSPIAGCAYRITEYNLWKQKNIDFKSGRGYIRNQTLVTGNATPATAYTTADTHNVFTTLRRNATTGYIKNRDSVARLLCWISIDGTEYGQSGQGIAVEYFTVDPNSALNIDGWEVYSLVIGANQNNVAYEVALGWYNMPFPSQGQSATTSQSRLTAQTIVNAVNLTNNTTQNSTVVDTDTIPNKSLTITLTSTGTISEYLVKVTALSSRENVAASFSEITSEIYIVNGTYHWNIEDVGRYFRIDIRSIGTADASNYVTITVILEGTS